MHVRYILSFVCVCCVADLISFSSPASQSDTVGHAVSVADRNNVAESTSLIYDEVW